MMWLFKEEESNVSVKVVGKVSWLGPILVLYTETTWIELPLERNICGVFDSLLNLCMINLAWYLYIELSFHKIAYGTIEGDLLLMNGGGFPDTSIAKYCVQAMLWLDQLQTIAKHSLHY